MTQPKRWAVMQEKTVPSFFSSFFFSALTTRIEWGQHTTYAFAHIHAQVE